MIVLLTLAGTAAVLFAVGLLVHRDLAEVAAQISHLEHRPDLERDLNQLWHDLQRLHDEQRANTDRRLREIETAVTQAQHSQGDLARFVNWMAPLVHEWSGTTPGSRR